jgi:hypothetical protein
MAAFGTPRGCDIVVACTEIKNVYIALVFRRQYDVDVLVTGKFVFKGTFSTREEAISVYQRYVDCCTAPRKSSCSESERSKAA